MFKQKSHLFEYILKNSKILEATEKYFKTRLIKLELMSKMYKKFHKLIRNQH